MPVGDIIPLTNEEIKNQLRALGDPERAARSGASWEIGLRDRSERKREEHSRPGGASR